MRPIKDLGHFDLFFFYGEGNLSLEIETESDIVSEILQPKRAMFYHRSSGSGVHDKENYPSGVALQVGLRFDIASMSAKRNTEVSDGQDGLPDRRVAISQSSINIKADNNGNLDVKVLYIMFANYEAINKISIPVVGNI